MKSVPCAAFSGIFPCGGGIKIQRSDSTESHEVMVRNLLRGEKLLNKLRSIVRNLLRGERKKFYAT